MGSVDLEQRYRESTTDELRAIARSNQYTPEAQETARRILLERGVEPPAAPPRAPDAPASPAPARPRRGWRLLWMAIPGLLLLGRKGCDGLLSDQQHLGGGAHPEGTSPTFYDVVNESPKRLAEAEASLASLAAAAQRPSVAPIHQVAWTPQKGPLGKGEEGLVGTWIARVSDGATRSAFMADRVAFRGAGGDDPESIATALLKDERLDTGCIWLELREDRHGFRRACAVVDDEPTAMDQLDPLTGKKDALGTAFEWAWDQRARTLRVYFDDDMLMPAADQGPSLRFRTWHLRFTSLSADGAKLVIKVEETIPEHDLVRRAQDTYEVSPGRFPAAADVVP